MGKPRAVAQDSGARVSGCGQPLNASTVCTAADERWQDDPTQIHAAAFPDDDSAAFVDGMIEGFVGWTDEDVQAKWEVDTIPTKIPSEP